MHPTYAKLIELAKDALPINDDDWGSDRQIDAENLFLDACEKRVAPFTQDFLDWSLKATTEERLQAALDFVREELGIATSRFFYRFPDREAAERLYKAKATRSPAISEVNGGFEVSWEANPLTDKIS